MISEAIRPQISETIAALKKTFNALLQERRGLPSLAKLKLMNQRKDAIETVALDKQIEDTIDAVFNAFIELRALEDMGARK